MCSSDLRVSKEHRRHVRGNRVQSQSRLPRAQTCVASVERQVVVGNLDATWSDLSGKQRQAGFADPIVPLDSPDEKKNDPITVPPSSLVRDRIGETGSLEVRVKNFLPASNVPICNVESSHLWW